LFIPYFSLFLLPFLFIVYFCTYVFFSFSATILVNKDVYKIITAFVVYILLCTFLYNFSEDDTRVPQVDGPWQPVISTT